jgi:hypothetical protein
VIISFRDKRTLAFFEGERVKAFQGFERQAMLGSTASMPPTACWRSIRPATGSKG